MARLLVRSRASADESRLWRAIVLVLLGLCVGTGAATADVYFHRGVESSAGAGYVGQVSGRDLATNVDLLAFSPDVVDAVADLLKTSGFMAVRQLFSWAVIEPTNGDFHWDEYDHVVNALSSRGVQIVAVLARSPDWARAPSTIGYPDAPPVSIADYNDFVQQVVQRYTGKVQFVQLWDLPNRPDHWGGRLAPPVEYADLVANARNAAVAANAEIKVVLAEFDPMADGALGADLRFLGKIYDLGRSGFFDVVAARIDGGTSSPFDRTVESRHEEFTRAILFRELMVDKGDGQKPIWFTHYGWRRQDGGPVTPEQQAEFLVAGIKRARSEWPWAGMLFAWSFMPTDTAGGDEAYALLNRDMTGTPAYEALRAFGTGPDAALAGTGYVPMESSSVSYVRTWMDQHLKDEQGREIVFKTTSEITASATLRFQGTGVLAYLRQSTEAGTVRATLDGKPLPGWPNDGTASIIPLRVRFLQAESVWYSLASGLADGPHELVLTLGDAGELTIGGIIVGRQIPLGWPVAVLTMTAFLLVVLALREVAYWAAMRAGYLQPRRDIELRPPLPHMPDWRPARRA